MKSNRFDRTKKVWLTLSQLYLDMDWSDESLFEMAKSLKETEFSLDEIEQINKHQVFPVLHKNLLSTAGVWEDFDEDWLVNSIISYSNSTAWIGKSFNSVKYFFLKKYFKNDWDGICHHWWTLNI